MSTEETGTQPASPEEARARLLAKFELERLRRENPALAEYADDPEQTVYGHAPGYGPEMTSRQLVNYFGALDEQPSWPNAATFAEAAAQYTADNSPPGGIDLEAKRKSQFLMSPERYSYMQEGPGRLMGLLSQLRDDPKMAMHFWDKSANSRITRDDYADPLGTGAGANYAQYAGVAQGASELLGSPLSPMGRSLHVMNIIPNTLQQETRGNSIGVAGASDLLSRRSRVGEIEIADVEDRLPGETDEERADRLFRRMAEIRRDREDMAPPSAEELARNRFGSWAPPAMGWGFQMLTGAADPTGPIGVVRGLRAIPSAYAAREATRALARSTGVRPSAARSMLGRASKVLPGQPAIPVGARVAGYRGVPASAYAAELRPPRLLPVLAEAAMRAAGEEAPSEAAVEAALAPFMEQPQRSWSEWALSPAIPMGDEQYAQMQKDKAEAAERAAVRTEVAARQRPNEIWNEWQRAQEELRKQRMPFDPGGNKLPPHLDWPAQHGAP